MCAAALPGRSVHSARSRRVTKEAISLKQVQPELKLASVRCTSCGNTFTIRSTRSEIVVDVCSNCHPAYTGTERATHQGSRIERFERRRQLAANPQTTRK
jgi:large subunit ribosomal protein L31